MTTPKILRRLRIDEVSSVDRGAGEGVKILLMKRNLDRSYRAPKRHLLFNDILKAREEVDDRARSHRLLMGDDYFDGDSDEDLGVSDRQNPEPNDMNHVSVLPDKLEGMVAALITAAPSLRRAQAVHFLIHTPHGRALAAQLSSISKQEDDPSMTRLQEMQTLRKYVKEGGMVAVAKQILEKGTTSLNEMEYTTLVQEEAARKGISFEKAFQEPTTQRAYKIILEAGYVKSLLYPNMMDTKPVTTEVGSSNTADDSAAAVRQLQALAESQHRRFEEVFMDPANRELASRTYRSSTSGSELQR